MTPDPRYPARCPVASHSTDNLPARGGKVRLNGRLISCEGGRGCLAAGEGTAVLEWAQESGEFGCGDIVAVEGEMKAGTLIVEKSRLLVPQSSCGKADGDWERFAARTGRLRQNLRIRASVLEAIRTFFNTRGFLEVETPTLVLAPGQEAHLQLFETEYQGEQGQRRGYLISSPEHHMKRLLGGGFDRIFQIGRCFRNGERSGQHNPEFTMLEWYRAYASYEEIMDDVEELVVHVARSIRGAGVNQYQGKRLDLEKQWPRLTVDQVFRECAGIDLRSCSTPAVFRRLALDLGYASVTAEDSWEDIFFKIFLEKVEPCLNQQGAVFLKDYPACLAALAKLKREDPAVAERVEVYIAGLELANGFTELNDPVEQRQRFLDEQRKRQQAGYPVHPLDDEFLAMLEQGMPPAGGMALGVDRLAMLLVDAASIDEVMAFPFAI